MHRRLFPNLGLFLLTCSITLAVAASIDRQTSRENVPIYPIRRRAPAPPPFVRMTPAQLTSAFEARGGPEEYLKARPETGKVTHRITPNGELLFAGVVALDADRTHVLLVEGHPNYEGWILPTSGWLDGETVENAAMRKSFLETGVGSTISKRLPGYKRAGSLTRYFQVEFEEAPSAWEVGPTRKWATWTEAEKLLLHVKRSDQISALKESDIQKEIQKEQ